MKQVTVNVYTYKELPNKVREKVRERHYNMCHSNEVFEDILQYDWKEAFGDTKMPEIQYDFSYAQGSGVNLCTSRNSRRLPRQLSNASRKFYPRSLHRLKGL